MKRLILLLALTASLGLANKTSAQVYGSISFNTFYNELSPYGRWVNDFDYGQVWIANDAGFEPYYNNGHWTYTNYGWTWVSDYPWGWAPFHYGRWAYLPAWGWAWVPGYEWGPAWVSWCQNDGYFGWAPLGPGLGSYRSFNTVPHNYWRFVRQQYIADPSFRQHVERPGRNSNRFRNATFINNTQVNNNTTYITGPGREAVERITRKPIETRPVAFTGTDEKTTGAPTNSGTTEQKQVRIYRPEMKPRQAVNDNGTPSQPGAAIEMDRLPKNNITKGEAVQQQGTINNNVPNNTAVQPTNTQSARDSRPVRQLPKDRMSDDKNGIDKQQGDDRRRIQLERQQAAQAQQNNDLRPGQNNQPDVNRQQQTAAQEEQRRRLQLEQQQRQQELQRRQAQQAEQEQRKLQLQSQQEEQRRQQQATQEQQRKEQQQQRDNELKQQQVREQREQQLQQRRQQNEQRQNDLRQQRTQQQQDRFQRPTETRPQRSFERPAPTKNFPGRKPIEK